MKVNEIYFSVQGESTRAGLPCVFVRLTYCNLRCTYCDTEYAFYEGNEMSPDAVYAAVKAYNCRLVEFTGGEPLLHPDALPLMARMCDDGYEVLIETGGSLPIEGIDQRVRIIMDLKCPSSGMQKKNRLENIAALKAIDEVKFVIGGREDYEWARDMMAAYNLPDTCSVLFSCVFGKLEPATLVQWILDDNLRVRFQLQLHKFIWHPAAKGV